MLDCPEQTHTSPIITSVSLIVSQPLMMISYGPPATGVATFVFHVAPFVVIAESVALFHPVVMNTFDPGPDQPHRVTESFCCNTIPDERTAGSLS